jgi:hypothetical protein
MVLPDYMITEYRLHGVAGKQTIIIVFYCHNQPITKRVDIGSYYIVESEIQRNTQRDISHISTSEDIDHFFQFAFESEISQFFA